MHPLIQKHQKDIAALCQKYGVGRLEVFGSAARGADFDSEHSDVDFLLELLPEKKNAFSINDYLNFQDELHALLGRPVDLVFPDSVKNPYVRADINRCRELVHAA